MYTRSKTHPSLVYTDYHPFSHLFFLPVSFEGELLTNNLSVPSRDVSGMINPLILNEKSK